MPRSSILLLRGSTEPVERVPAWVPMPEADLCADRYISRKECSVHGRIAVRLRCRDPECLSCRRAWAAEEAASATARLAHAAGVLRYAPWLIWHVVIAPRPGTVPATEEGLRALREAAREAARRHGIVGGCSVVHHSMRNHPGEWRPHVHIVGFVAGRWEEGPIASGPLKGHVIKILSIGDPEAVFYAGLDPERKAERAFWANVRGLLAYELGHCVKLPRWHALTWWGELSYNKLSDPDEAELDRLEELTGLELGHRKLDHCPVPGCGRLLDDVDEHRGTRAALMTEYEGRVVFADDYGPGPPREGVIDDGEG